MKRKAIRLRLTFASRILAGYLVVFGIASWVFYDSLIDEIKPVVRQSAESVLIDTANIFAELIAEDVANGNIPQLAAVAERFKARRLSAVVWQHLRTDVLLDFYVTDADGIVLFNSEGIDIGADYSQWRDVYLSLRDEYGARSTRSNPKDPTTSVMFVSAPIYHNDELQGVVSVYNSNETMRPFVDASRQKVLYKWLLVLFACGIVALLLSFWLSRSVARLAHYAQRVRHGETPEVPKLLGGELKQLAQSLEDMRIELEGKHYVERYVQTLTHELKSPMAAIRGAAEMLQEELPAAVKEQFLNNIHSQNSRMQRSIDQLLRLSALENQAESQQKQSLSLSELCQQSMATLEEKARLCGVTLTLIEYHNVTIDGDRALLLLAIDNILDNALAFSSQDTEVVITVDEHSISIIDQGCGIPEYAVDKIGSRFYSLPRPNGQPKSTGLGLALSQEICRMHNARLTITNRSDGQSGAQVEIRFT